ncbi:unnamed protein product [Phytophthora fragariaefolia]|uniref:Unnamed protein product n=1 Tax=Phytophthora fragariaefolia TaxID=1490495 RepID=A0A9W6XM26_9STRA|nr:unnamed protein product [Phytophthora fragariaefolia]
MWPGKLLWHNNNQYGPPSCQGQTQPSNTRVVAVCLLTPIPALLATSLIDCIPLRPPDEGWRANKTLWIRLFIEAFAVAIGLISQVREVIITGTISTTGAVVISAGTAACYVTIAIVVAVYWQFPVPFGFVISVAPVVFFFGLWTILVVGPHIFFTTPLLRQQLKSQIVIVATQGLVGVLYPCFSIVFIRFSGARQAAFVLIMPLIKYTTKQIIANAAANLHEYVGPIVVFSVDVFNVFYIAICMQSSKSLATTLIMVTADGFHMFVALRTIFHLANVVQKRRISDTTSHTVDYVKELPRMVRNVFLTSAATLQSVFGPHSFGQRQKHGVTTGMNLINVAPKLHQFIPSIQLRARSLDSFQQGKWNSYKQSISRKLVKLMHTITAIAPDKALKAAIGRRGVEEAAWEGLRALFHSEYLLMAEYVEAVLPMLYVVYLTLIFNLPVARFYPHTSSLTPEKLVQNAVSIMMYATVEAITFIGLLILMRHKFGMSPLYQLAFVLETQVYILQGHLFLSLRLFSKWRSITTTYCHSTDLIATAITSMYSPTTALHKRAPSVDPAELAEAAAEDQTRACPNLSISHSTMCSRT